MRASSSHENTRSVVYQHRGDSYSISKSSPEIIWSHTLDLNDTHSLCEAAWNLVTEVRSRPQPDYTGISSRLELTNCEGGWRMKMLIDPVYWYDHMADPDTRLDAAESYIAQLRDGRRNYEKNAPALHEEKVSGAPKYCDYQLGCTYGISLQKGAFKVVRILSFFLLLLW